MKDYMRIAIEGTYTCTIKPRRGEGNTMRVKPAPLPGPLDYLCPVCGDIVPPEDCFCIPCDTTIYCRDCLYQIAKHSGYDGISIAGSSKIYPCADDDGMVDVSGYPYTKG